MHFGVVAVKSFERAKKRLSPHLSPEQRVAVAEALFEDALALTKSVTWLEWCVVSDEPRALRAAEAHGYLTAQDDGGGLNPALSKAIAVVAEAGADSLTVLPCDLPLAEAEDLRDLADTGATSDLVVVPSDGDGGTNALYLSPPDLLQPRFGPGSLQAHVDAASQRGLRCSILRLPRLALDIDAPEDIDAYLGLDPPPRGRTYEVLSSMHPGSGPPPTTP